MNALTQFWKDFDITAPPYLHPQDRGFITDHVTLDYDRYQQSFGEVDDSAIHSGLLPRPYSGNLLRADVFILMLNAGFHPVAYYAEEHDDALRKSIVRELRQDLADEEFPFRLLDPQFCYYSGFTYWERRLRKLCEAVAERQGIAYRDSLRFVSRRLAVIQLFPYRSRTFKHGKLLRCLPSVRVATDFGAYLRARAERGDITVVVMRKTKQWGFPEQYDGGNVVIYHGPEARGARLNDRAMEAILRQVA